MAPTLVQIRPGVAFEPQAAASFRRAESDLGRQIGTNSTYRDWVKQLLMHNAWNRYVRGEGPYPGHSMALHPDYSKHCLGLAMDSDEWVSSSFNEFMAERGWIRTAANDPTERHHYEYQAWRDQHINRPAADTSTPITPEPEEEDDDMAKNSGFYYRDGGTGEGTWKYLICNTTSGWYHEYGQGVSSGKMPSAYNNALAAAFDTGSFASITASHAGAIKRACDAVRVRTLAGDVSVTIED